MTLKENNDIPIASHSSNLGYFRLKGNYPLQTVLGIIFISLAVLPSLLQAQVVDANTMTHKIMAGYQGWFRTPGDNPDDNQGWSHLFNADLTRPGFDTWPDMSEYSAEEKAVVPGFTHPDGSKSYLYSAQNPKTVLRHFQWMKQYGIDGVWLSEFCDHFAGGNQQWDTTGLLTIMRNVRNAATATGRIWAFMWDMSGFGSNTSKSEVYAIIVNQWKKMVDEGVTTDSRYMHHNGNPVLLLWGFFPERAASQPEYMNPVIDFFQTPGKYRAALVSGVDPTWRTRGTTEFQTMLMRMPALQPWSVGRVLKDETTGYKIQNTSLWAGDIEKCKANHVLFMPVFNAGTHIAGPPPIPPALPIVPRRTGHYLWEQFVAASKIKDINSAFIAMFDEINEGTQIMKVDNRPPVQFPFLTYDGATSDYYMRLVGVGGKMLKDGTPITETIPVSPFATNKWYKIKSRTNGLTISSISKASSETLIMQTPDSKTDSCSEWQFIYDEAGYFKIMNRASGKYLSHGDIASENKPVGQSAESSSDNLKWHLEWDGTGYCKILGKTGKRAISNGSGTVNSLLLQVTDANSDNLRWKIEESLLPGN